MKKIFAVLLVIVMAVSLVAGCGSSEKQSDGNKEQKEITILCHSSWKTAGIEAAAKYAEESCGVKIIFEEVPEGDEGSQLIYTKIASDEVPDILYWQPACWANTYMGNDKFEDLSDLTDWSQDYDTDALALPTFTVDNRMIGAPFGSCVVYGVAYNKSVFEKNNINIPQTKEDWWNTCETLKTNGITPIYLSAGDPWTLQLYPLGAFGQEYNANEKLITQMDNNEIGYAGLTSYLLPSLKDMQDMVNKGWVQDTYMSDTYADAQMALIDGECAMYPMATYIQREFNNLGVTDEQIDNIGFFVTPEAKDGGAYTAPNCLYVPKQGKNVDLAKKVVAALVSRDANEAFFKTEEGIPFVKNLNCGLSGVMKDAQAMLNDNNMKMAVAPETITKYTKVDFELLIQDMLAGNISAEQVLETLDESTAKQAKEAGDPNWK